MVKDFHVTKRKKHNIEDEDFILTFEETNGVVNHRLTAAQVRYLIEKLDRSVNCFGKC